MHRFVPTSKGAFLLRSRSRSIQSTATNPPGLHHCLAYRCVRTPVKAQLLPVALASAQMRNPYYSITVAEVLDSPLGYLALMAVPIGLYFMFKILLWDYTVSQPSLLSIVTGQAYLCQSIMLIMTHISDVSAKHTTTYNTACHMLAICNSCTACCLHTTLRSIRE